MIFTNDNISLHSVALNKFHIQMWMDVICKWSMWKYIWHCPGFNVQCLVFRIHYPHIFRHIYCIQNPKKKYHIIIIILFPDLFFAVLCCGSVVGLFSRPWNAFNYNNFSLKINIYLSIFLVGEEMHNHVYAYVDRMMGFQFDFISFH